MNEVTAISLRIPTVLHAAIKEAAKQDERSANQWICRALDNAIKQQPEQGGKQDGE